MAETSFVTPYEEETSTSYRQVGRYQKSVIIDVRQPRPESPAIPSKPGDRHLTIGVIMCLISSICFNPFALCCAVSAVIFSVKSRAAEMSGRKDLMQENDKTAFAFVIFSIIGWIISLCVAGFIVYREFCGPTGAMCDTRL